MSRILFLTSFVFLFFFTCCLQKQAEPVEPQNLLAQSTAAKGGGSTSIINCAGPTNLVIQDVTLPTTAQLHDIKITWVGNTSIVSYDVFVKNIATGMIVFSQLQVVGNATNTTTAPIQLGIDYEVTVIGNCQIGGQSNPLVTTFRLTGGGPVIAIDDNLDNVPTQKIPAPRNLVFPVTPCPGTLQLATCNQILNTVYFKSTADCSNTICFSTSFSAGDYVAYLDAGTTASAACSATSSSTTPTSNRWKCFMVGGAAGTTSKVLSFSSGTLLPNRFYKVKIYNGSTFPTPVPCTNCGVSPAPNNVCQSN